MIHTRRDAEYIKILLKKLIKLEVKIIGSLATESESEHDIDLLITSSNELRISKKQIYDVLDAKSVENTDWGGWYFKSDFFGDVDIFFSDKGFDDDYKKMKSYTMGDSSNDKHENRCYDE